MFTKWFKKRKKPYPFDGDISEVAIRIEPIIDQVANDIFRNYTGVLMLRPSSYIVPAVWANEDSPGIDPVAREINRMVGPAVKSVFETLELKNPSRSQVYGISYLVRGLIISKVAYMVELLKNTPMNIRPDEGMSESELKSMRPIGNA